uniref:Reverse transcriptase/retrotransposon-derived protein RNase H-like domain-containing protein n=1 Tax=Amphimedon queenslandica TaxID=400682 RepID=A0A1X7VJP7_AMPQE
MLYSSSVLTLYDEKKPLVVACDASPYELGAVLSHRMSDGTDLTVTYASSTLSVAEKKYSQLEKEALAIICAVRKFHDYIYVSLNRLLYLPHLVSNIGQLHYQHITVIQYKPVSADNIKMWTDKDPTLSRLRQILLTGGEVPDDAPQLKPYSHCFIELSVANECLL